MWEAGSLATAVTSMSGVGSIITFDTVTVPQHPDWGTLSGTVRIGAADEDYLVTDPPDMLSGLSAALGDSLPLLLFKASGNGISLDNWILGTEWNYPDGGGSVRRHFTGVMLGRNDEKNGKIVSVNLETPGLTGDMRALDTLSLFSTVPANVAHQFQDVNVAGIAITMGRHGLGHTRARMHTRTRKVLMIYRRVSHHQIYRWQEVTRPVTRGGRVPKWLPLPPAPPECLAVAEIAWYFVTRVRLDRHKTPVCKSISFTR